MTTLAIIAIAITLGSTYLQGWRDALETQAGAEAMLRDMINARSTAVSRGQNVAIELTPATGYRIWVENGEPNFAHDTGEKILANVTFPKGTLTPTAYHIEAVVPPITVAAYNAKGYFVNTNDIRVPAEIMFCEGACEVGNMQMTLRVNPVGLVILTGGRKPGA